MSGEIVGLLSELECEDFVHFEADSMKSVELKDDDECWIMGVSSLWMSSETKLAELHSDEP